MRSRSLVLLSGTVTLGLGYWLSEASRDSREIWLTMGAWILGFWFAGGLLGGSSDEAEDEDEVEVEDDEEKEE
ncbi:MAG: hypothetical protein ACI8W3_000522 [Myxococcota bacterium]|jgi:hypothetical protein